MSLIIYPDPAADSFVTLPQAELYISMLTLNGAEWALLTPDHQEQLLRIAYRDIIDHTDPTKYPTPLPVCVAESQALMAVHDHINALSGGATSTATTGALKKQKVGPIEREFYDVGGTTSTGGKVYRVPDMAMKCLEGIGYVFKKTQTKGLTQTILGHR